MAIDVTNLTRIRSSVNQERVGDPIRWRDGEASQKAQWSAATAAIMTLVGVLFAVLYLRAAVGPGLLVAIILLVAPISYVLAFDPAALLERYPSIVVATGFLSVWVLRLMPSVRYRHVFGGTDATYTFAALTYSFSGTGRFELANVHTETFRFGGLFALYRLFQLGLGLSPETVALWIHPTLNALAMLLVVALAQHFVSFRLAMVAGLIFGWDFIAIRLGAELRQEALGILFFAGIVLSVISGMSQRRQIAGYRLVGVVLLVAVIFTHFVSSVHTVGILVATTILITVLSKTRVKPSMSRHVFTDLTILSVVGLLGYLIYAAQSLDFVVTFATRIVTELARPYGSSATPANQGLGLLQYGLLVAAVNWTVRALLGVGVIWLALSLRTRDADWFSRVFILMLTSIYTGLSLISAVIPIGLNPWRFYHFWLIPSSIVIVLGIRYLVDKSSAGWRRCILTVFLCAYAISTLVRFPQYLIGSVHGLRGNAAIDELHQEYSTEDLAAAEYINRLLPGVQLAGTSEDWPAFGGLTNRGFVILQSTDGTVGASTLKQPISAVGVRTVSKSDADLASLTVWAQAKFYSSPSTAIYGYITPAAADPNISPEARNP